MKLGPRKISIKKSISARTTGKVNRKVKSSINPLYGKKGIGIVNDPKKAAYNAVYDKTTIDTRTVISSKRREKKFGLTTLLFYFIVLGFIAAIAGTASEFISGSLFPFLIGITMIYFLASPFYYWIKMIFSDDKLSYSNKAAMSFLAFVVIWMITSNNARGFWPSLIAIFSPIPAAYLVYVYQQEAEDGSTKSVALKIAAPIASVLLFVMANFILA